MARRHRRIRSPLQSADLPALEVEAARKALEVARVKEKQERKIRLEKQTATELSEYHQWKWQKRPANKMSAR
jgi:hypothetical protein